MIRPEKFAEPYTGGAAAQEEVKQTLIPALLEEFADGVEVLETPFELPQLKVAPQRLRDVCIRLKERGFNVLMDVGGVDYMPRTPRFEVVYHFVAVPELWRLRLRVPVEESAPEVPTICDLWPSAEHAEREVWDLFGIRFADHPNLTRILLPEEWVGHPLRKDYPLRGARDGAEGPPADRNWFHAPKRPGHPPGTTGLDRSAQKGGD